MELIELRRPKRLLEMRHVEAEVRELVRRRRLVPVQDRSAMRRLNEVVLDYDERVATSTPPPLPDPRVAARAVYDTVAGFGPLPFSSTTHGRGEEEEGAPVARFACALPGSRVAAGS